MQRISVDLPEPDGPQITMRSPLGHREVDVAQHVEALPYHLLTFSKRDDGIGSWFGVSLLRRRVSARLATLTCFSTHRL